MKLAIAACKRPAPGPRAAANAEIADPLSGPKSTQDAGRKSDRAHRAGQNGTPNETRPAAPERHPDDPADPRESFANDHALADECAWSYARIVWMASQLKTALTEHVLCLR